MSVLFHDVFVTDREGFSCLDPLRLSLQSLSLEHCISLVSSLLLSSSVQLIIQAVPVIGLLFIAMGYVGSTHVQLYSGAMACSV